MKFKLSYLFGVLVLIGIQIIFWFLFLPKNEDYNKTLLKKNIELQQMNINLTREVFENYPFRDFNNIKHYYFDTLMLIVDSCVNNYPILNSNLIKEFNFYKQKLSSKDSFDLKNTLKLCQSKSEFELKLLSLVNEIGKYTFERPKCIDRVPLTALAINRKTPLGVPLKVFLFKSYDYYTDFPKNLKTNIKVSFDSTYPGILYLPADKLGDYVFKGFYKMQYLGEEVPIYFDPLEYTVSEPDIRTKIIDKDFLDINKDNLIEFDFGLNKSNEINIKVIGATLKIIKHQQAIIHPTNKIVKIFFEQKENNEIIPLGFKEYIAK